MAYPSVPAPTVAVDLVFSGTATAPTPASHVALDLVFGSTAGGTGVPLSISMSVVLASPSPTFVVQYDNRAPRYLQTASSAPHQVGTRAETATQGVHAVATVQRRETVGVWGVATARQQRVAVSQQAAATQVAQSALAWDVARALAYASAVRVDDAHHLAVPLLAAVWQLAARRGAQSDIVGQVAERLDATRSMPWQVAAGRALTVLAPAGASTRRIGVQATVVPWQIALREVPGLSVPDVVAVVPAKTYALVFRCPTRAGQYPALPGLSLVFGSHPCPGIVQPPLAPFYILPARTYMAVHSLIAHRLPDMTEVPLYGGTRIGADKGSFAWSFSATGPEGLFDLLSPVGGVPQQLQITMDGMVWVFAVKPPERSFAFGKRAASISGQSVTALLAAPWQREVQYNNTSPANAQQLADQVLNLTGVALDWGITDWLVPAHAWSRTGTPLSAVQAIAEAAGGYLQSHRSAPTLQVRHPYPVMSDGSPGGPWNWGLGTADIELAPDAVILGSMTGGDYADINGVYVSGTTQGVLALVKRTGTAGDKLAAQQTDALITHADAAMQRGLAVLGKGGAQYHVSLDLPILTGLNQPGVIDVGSLVQINDAVPWRGRVESVSVTHDFPKARQTIVLERHL